MQPLPFSSTFPWPRITTLANDLSETFPDDEIFHEVPNHAATKQRFKQIAARIEAGNLEGAKELIVEQINTKEYAPRDLISLILSYILSEITAHLSSEPNLENILYNELLRVVFQKSITPLS